MSDAPSKTTQVVAVLLLISMIALSVTGDRDDKAWTWMTTQVEGWFGGADGAKKKKK